jgi:hypothetical protein
LHEQESVQAKRLMFLQEQDDGTTRGTLVHAKVKLEWGGCSGAWRRVKGLNLEADLPFDQKA